MTVPDPIILAALRRMRLVETTVIPPMRRLPGGVSSDIWRVDLADGPVCVKRALPRLKVDAVWEVPIERNRYEWEWMREAARIDPGCVPPLVAQDVESGCFVIAFLDPETYPVWKSQLQRGIASAETAGAVGRRLVAIHAATADDRDIAERFATDHIFHAIRLEPYLLATAARHQDVGPRLRDLASRTACTRRTLVHGDASPKNVLVGPDGPIFLDAECAWYGDPAFDLAFCLTHLLLKCLWTPGATAGFLRSFDALAEAYTAGVGWEDPGGLERRAAHLVPGLLLARVDGKSPVEYLTAEADRAYVRQVAIALLHQPVDSLSSVRRAWTPHHD